MNKKIGNSTEKEAVKILSKYGWWAHIFGYKAEGQPCDIIALKNGEGLLIDIKHCSGDRFDFVRVESNQRNCFNLARKKGNSRCGFAIYFEKSKEWKWLDMCELEYYESKGVKSLHCKDLEDFEDEIVY